MSSTYNAPDLSEKLLTTDETVVAAQQAPPPQQQQQWQPQQPVMAGSGMNNSATVGGASTNMTSVMLSQPNIAATTPQQQAQPSSTVNFQPDGSASFAIQDGTLIVDAGDMMLQSGQGLRGESQHSTHYRDWPFAIAFFLQIGIVTIMAFTWGMSSLNHEIVYDDEENAENANGDDGTSYKPTFDGSTTDDDDEVSSVRLSGVLYLCMCTSVASIGISSIALNIMTKYAEQLIQLSLVASCIGTFFLAVSLFGMGLDIVGFFCLVMLGLTCFYVYAAWHRIPFAAANLTAGLEAVHTNFGVCMIAYGVSFAGNIWVLLWALACVGVTYKETKCTSDGICESDMDPISGFLFLLSYYWTSQVLKNVLNVTVAGVVGTWWFAPQEASHMWSPAILDSFRRATSYSFGSICMASLLVALIRSLEAMVARARRFGRGNQILLCIVECILNLIGDIAAYFNKWALCYVGLYGYDYLTAGRKVTELFRERGWTAIICDHLAARVLVLVCVVIAAATGLVGVLLNKATGWADPSLGTGPEASIIVFILCLIIGLSLSLITMSVVMSAVDTVIVSFAEAPAEFESNHPRLSQQMKGAWQAVYPNECGFN